MSFGVSVKTVAGEVLLDENFVVPALVGKLALSFQATYTPSNNVSLRIDEYRATLPAGSGPLIFWTMPDLAANCGYNFNYSAGLASAGFFSVVAGVARVFVFRPSATARLSSIPNGLPEGYCFGTNLSPVGSAYGLQVFRSDGVLLFDVGRRHLQLASSFNMPLPVTGFPDTPTSASIGTQPSKPAYFIAPAGAVRWESNAPVNSSTATFFETSWWRSSGGTVMNCLLNVVGSEGEDSQFTQSTFVGQGPAFTPIIDAALWD